jgi:hypothetical protein
MGIKVYIVFISQWGEDELVEVFGEESKAAEYVAAMLEEGYKGYYYEPKAVK